MPRRNAVRRTYYAELSFTDGWDPWEYSRGGFHSGQDAYAWALSIAKRHNVRPDQATIRVTPI